MAKTMPANRPASTSLDVALRLTGVTFRWTAPLETDKPIGSHSVQSIQQSSPFSLDNIDLEMPRGRLVAIVGRVGSGKSSLLQGVSTGVPSPLIPQIIGEMITMSGKVEIGGQLAYCQQTGTSPGSYKF